VLLQVKSTSRRRKNKQEIVEAVGCSAIIEGELGPDPESTTRKEIQELESNRGASFNVLSAERGKN